MCTNVSTSPCKPSLDDEANQVYRNGDAAAMAAAEATVQAHIGARADLVQLDPNQRQAAH